MNVLSLFDGMSCGQIALERANIKVEKTVPEDYFENSVSSNQAKKMIGNGWTVDVIAHIFSYINLEK